MKINQKDYRNCKHYFVCAYERRFDYKLGDLLKCIRKPEVTNNEKQRKLIFEFLAKACQFFEKDCYSKDSKHYKEDKNENP